MISARLGLVLGLSAWLFGTPALASPVVSIQAQISDDLRSITGTTTVEGGDEWIWVDPLADLPEPRGDRDRMRTWPGRRDEGAVSHDPATGSFTTELPRRFGALGVTRSGLYANGGWYPQPLSDDGIPTVRWEVVLALPDGVLGTVGDITGTGTLRWSGTAERVAIAAVRDGSVTTLSRGDLSLQIVSRRPARPRIIDALERQLTELEPTLDRGTAAVVIAPMRTRLVRPGPGVLYLSDRAWRLTAGLRHFHDTPVRRGLAAALLDEPDPFERDLIAAAASDEASTTGMRDTLKWLAWIPLVDQTLNDRSMPFATETLGDVVPEHPVADDLVERFDPTWPGTAVVLQLDDAWGPTTSDSVAAYLYSGVPLERAAEELGLPPQWVIGFDAPPPEQDYRLEVAEGQVRVERSAPAAANAQAVVVTMGDDHQVWMAPGGPGSHSWTRASDGPVVLDPDGALPQTERIGERHPSRVTTTVTASAGNISLQPLALDGHAQVNLRRADDSRMVWSPGVFFGDQVLAEARMSATRMAGRPLDALTREHQLAVWPSVLWLDPRYTPISDSGSGLALGASYTWDTKGGALFPLRGHTIGIGVEAGTLTTSPQAWMLGRADAAGIVALHPRLVLAAQLAGALARSDFPHKQLDLGALEGMLSVPIGSARGHARALSRAELRVVPLRQASIPLLLLWGSEIQVIGGLEAGVLDTDAGRVSALGATAGMGLVFDWAGAKPSMTGVTAGWPVWWEGMELERTPWPQLVVRAEQWF